MLEFRDFCPQESANSLEAYMIWSGMRQVMPAAEAEKRKEVEAKLAQEEQVRQDPVRLR